LNGLPTDCPAVADLKNCYLVPVVVDQVDDAQAISLGIHRREFLACRRLDENPDT